MKVLLIINSNSKYLFSLNILVPIISSLMYEELFSIFAKSMISSKWRKKKRKYHKMITRNSRISKQEWLHNYWRLARIRQHFELQSVVNRHMNNVTNIFILVFEAHTYTLYMLYIKIIKNLYTFFGHQI